jgi:hypothetical protein
VDGQSKMATFIKSHIACVVHNLVVDISGVNQRKPLKLPYIEGSKCILPRFYDLRANLLQSASSNRKWWDGTDWRLCTLELDGWLS